jgi:phospholipase C
MSRRLLAVLGTVAVVTASWAATAPVAAAAPGATDGLLPAEQLNTDTPIKHFVVLMQENHSFDNYFGNYPGADGVPAGTCMPVDPTGATSTECVKPFHIGGKAIVDMGHNSAIHDAEFNGGAMNGFISAFVHQRNAGNEAMGFYDDRDIPYYWNVADNYVLFDRLFTSAAGGSVWNHMFWATGSPGNPVADALRPEGFDDVPTIFDRLQAAGISWKFYVQNYKPEITFRNPGSGDSGSQVVWVPPLNYNRFLDDPALHSRIVGMDQYYEDLHNGTLPAVSFMVPAGASEHPPGSIQSGERFVRGLVTELMRSSAWNSSAFMWTYDDWGGWYDHVPPAAVDQYGYGFRSPALLVSPYAKPGHVDHTTLDFTSELKFIESNWGVAPLAERDRNANDIRSAFDFDSPARAPVLLDRSRTVTAVPDTRTTAVYLTYGAAVLLLGALVVLAAIGSMRRRKAAEGALA